MKLELNVDLDKLRAITAIDEGRENIPYLDSKGFLTVGIGHKIEGKKIPEAAIDIIFDHDLKEAHDELINLGKRKGVDVKILPCVIQEVLLMMSFQLGATKLSGFNKMWIAAQDRNWVHFIEEMIDSKWAREDTPLRAKRHVKMIDDWLLKIYTYEEIS